MITKLKVAVAISSHSPSFYTKFTVGTLIKETQHCDLNIHIGFHTNYNHYTSDYSMFNELRDWCQFHAVDEIDWMQHNINVYRYSLMHSLNLQNIFKNIQYYDFDYLVILDNDLYIKQDFINILLNKFPGSDLIGSYFDDEVNIRKVNTLLDGSTEYFAPKISVWNLILSRNLFDKIMENPRVIEPQKINNIMYDTFALVLHKVKKEWNMNLNTISVKEMEDLVKHFYTSSFNYGLTKNRGSMEKPFQLYNEVFPEGVYQYLKTNNKNCI